MKFRHDEYVKNKLKVTQMVIVFDEYEIVYGLLDLLLTVICYNFTRSFKVVQGHFEVISVTL